MTPRDTCQKCGSNENVITTHHNYIYKCIGDDGRMDTKYIRFYLKCVPCKRKFKRDFAIGTIAFLQEIEYETRRLHEEARLNESQIKTASKKSPEPRASGGVQECGIF